MDATLTKLKRAFPGREFQIDELWNLFGLKDELLAPSVYIYGGPSTGKSAIVGSLLTAAKIRHAAILNLIECYTTKILLESILNQLAGYRIDSRNGLPYAKCDNLMEFINCLNDLNDKIDLNGSVIVLDKAEELRDMDANLLPSFLRFKELTGIEISIIFISEIVFEKYYFRLNIVEPIKIRFPQYTKDELLEILSIDFPNMQKLIANSFNVTLDFNNEFYRSYLNTFLSVFYRNCRDLKELRSTSASHFIKYCEPIARHELTINDSMKLWKNIAPILKSSLEVLYLRVPASACHETNKSLENFGNQENLNLPFYGKYLLISAYLASYNSSKDDKRLFVTNHGKKRKTKQDINKNIKISEKLSTEIGPNAFSLDRLLAIFYSILEDKVAFNNHLLVQITSLVELQLLSLVSDNSMLDGRKYKCNVNFECIQTVSKMVGFNIRKYLSDFN